MGLNVEQRRRRDGKIVREVEIPGAIDRRLAHHARLRRIPLARILRNAAIRECQLLDELELTEARHSNVTTIVAGE